MANENYEPMNEEVCSDLLETLKSINAALESRNAAELKELSDHTIHCASIFHEKRAIYIAMIAYSLSKIIEKGELQRKYTENLEDFIRGISQNLKALADFLKNREIQKFDGSIKNMLKSISEFDASFSKYIIDLLEFAKVQKGARIHEHGISLSTVAELLGITKWELMEKLGETKVHEEARAPKDIKERFEKMKKFLEK